MCIQMCSHLIAYNRYPTPKTTQFLVGGFWMNTFPRVRVAVRTRGEGTRGACVQMMCVLLVNTQHNHISSHLPWHMANARVSGLGLGLVGPSLVLGLGLGLVLCSCLSLGLSLGFDLLRIVFITECACAYSGILHHLASRATLSIPVSSHTTLSLFQRIKPHSHLITYNHDPALKTTQLLRVYLTE